jgi:serine/threonine protein kinase
MELLEEALQRPSPERGPYLRSQCASDEELYDEVMEALMWEERMGSFLCEPFLNSVAFAPPFEPGQVVTERFEIVREIGAGGMGVVYEAFDRKRKQRIAIKAAKPGFQRLLSPELEGALQVRHHNICLVNEIHATQTGAGEIDFLTMELLQGETLSSYFAAGGKLSHEEALGIAVQLCAAVAEAHRSGVLHRDLKSGNVILCKEQAGGSRAVITDFGLASQLSSPNGDLGGTPGYMAPELWNGGQASKASDLYALGVIFYQMVSGVMPYAQPDAGDAPPDAPTLTSPRQSMIDGVHSGAATVLPPAPSTRTRNLDPRWDRVIMGCLALVPEDRIQDADEVRHELTKKRIRKAPFAVATLILLFLFAVVWFVPSLNRRFVEFVWPPNVRAETVVRLTEDGGTFGPGALSTDGKYFVYQKETNGKFSLWFQQVSTGSSQKITPDLEVSATDVSISPDNTLLYYELYDMERKENRVYRVPTLGGSPELFLTHTVGTVAFSPDARKIAYKRLGDNNTFEVVVANPDRSEPQVWYSRKMHVDDVLRSAPAWSPDGKLIALSRWVLLKQGGYSALSFIRADGHVSELKVDSIDIEKLVWLRDGTGLAFVGNPTGPEPEHIFLVSFPGGNITRVTNDTSSYDGRSLSITADGKALFAISGVIRTSLWLAAEGFRNVRQLSSTGNQLALDFDGRQVVYVSNVGEAAAIWRTGIDLSPSGRISPLELTVSGHPALSPDGNELAIAAASHHTENGIWIANTEGGTFRQLAGSEYGTDPLFSPDEKAILFDRDDSDLQRHLYRIPVSGGPASRVSDLPIGHAWSIAGDSVLCSYFDPTASHWRRGILSLRSGQLVRALQFPGWTWVLRFTPDGQSITYVDNHDGTSNIWSAPTEGGTPRKLTNFTSQDIFDFAWSRDGKQLVLSRGTQYSDAVLIRNFQ